MEYISIIDNIATYIASNTKVARIRVNTPEYSVSLIEGADYYTISNGYIIYTGDISSSRFAYNVQVSKNGEVVWTSGSIRPDKYTSNGKPILITNDIDLQGGQLRLESNVDIIIFGGSISNGAIFYNNSHIIDLQGRIDKGLHNVVLKSVIGEGEIRYDSDLHLYKYYNGSNWCKLDGTLL